MWQQITSKEISQLYLIFTAHSNTETSGKTSSGYEFITVRSYQKERTLPVSSGCAFQSPNNSLHSNSRKPNIPRHSHSAAGISSYWLYSCKNQALTYSGYILTLLTYNDEISKL